MPDDKQRFGNSVSVDGDVEATGKLRGEQATQAGEAVMLDATGHVPTTMLDIPEVDLSGYVPTTREVNGHALSSDLELTAADVGALPDTITVASSGADGLMSSSDKAKLDGIASGANAYELPVGGAEIGGVKNGGNVVIGSDGSMSVTIPDASVTQDASGITVGSTALQDASTSRDGLMTAAYVTSLGQKARVINVASLPTTGIDETAIYTIPDTESNEENARIAYVRIDGAWAPIGGSGGPSVSFYLTVNVTASAGSPDLSGIAVTATSTEGSVSGTTGADGTVTMEVKQGSTYTVSCSKEDFIFSGTPQTTITELSNSVSLTCYEAPRITVNVGGVNYAGRTVTLTPSSGSPITGTTDTSGSVTFRGLAITTYTVTCNYPSGQGVSPASRSQTTVAGGSYTLAFTVLSKPTLTVTVSSSTGNMSGRTITATPTSGSAVTGTTNASGVATLTLMAGVQYTVTSNVPSGYFSVSSQTVTLAAGADSDMTFTLQRKPVVTVTVTDASGGGNEVGRTVQMTNGTDTQTATTVTGGTCSFTANGTGAYTFTITNLPDGASASAASQTLAANGTYSVSIEMTFGWTHSVAFNATTFQTDPLGCLTYADDLAGATRVSNSATSLAKVTSEGYWAFDPDTGMDAEGCFYATFQSGSSGKYLHQLLDPYNLDAYIAIWDDDAKEWDYSQTGTSAVSSEDTMICLPTMYRKGSSSKLVHSSKADQGTAYAHTIGGHVYDLLAIGVYLGYNQSSVLRSISGVSATGSVTRANFRTYAAANTVRSGHAMQWNYHMWRLMAEKCYIRAKTFNLQTIAQGGLSYSASTTGLCDALGPYAGNTSGQTNASKFLIENFWGSKYQFIDDVYCTGTTMYVGQNATPTDDTSNKTAMSLTFNTTGFAGTIETSDMAWGMAKATGGSATTGLCDYQDLAFGTSNPLVSVGGYSGNVSNGRAGPSCAVCYNLSPSVAYYGARLAFVLDV